jgi:hypothetical protein
MVPAKIPTIPTVQFRGRTLKKKKKTIYSQNGLIYNKEISRVKSIFTQNEVCAQKLVSNQQHHKELLAFAQILEIEIWMKHSVISIYCKSIRPIYYEEFIHKNERGTDK